MFKNVLSSIKQYEYGFVNVLCEIKAIVVRLPVPAGSQQWFVTRQLTPDVNPLYPTTQQHSHSVSFSRTRSTRPFPLQTQTRAISDFITWPVVMFIYLSQLPNFASSAEQFYEQFVPSQCPCPWFVFQSFI